MKSKVHWSAQVLGLLSLLGVVCLVCVTGSWGADPQPAGSLVQAVTQAGSTHFVVLTYLPAPGSPAGTWLLQEEQRSTADGPTGSVKWWYLTEEGRVARYLLRDAPGEEIRELPAFLGRRVLPRRISEEALLEIDPGASPETITVAAGTFEVLHGTLPPLEPGTDLTELFCSNEVPVSGLVKALHGSGTTIELHALSSEALNLLPDPAPTPRWGEQSDRLPLGRR